MTKLAPLLTNLKKSQQRLRKIKRLKLMVTLYWTTVQNMKAKMTTARAKMRLKLLKPLLISDKLDLKSKIFCTVVMKSPMRSTSVSSSQSSALLTNTRAPVKSSEKLRTKHAEPSKLKKD